MVVLRSAAYCRPLRTLSVLPTQSARTYAVSSTRQQAKLSRPLPKGTWDSHMHVIEPEKFPLHPSVKYTPHAHTLDDARMFYAQFGITNMVLVQPSIYANDNSCMLAALRELTPKHGRAVVGLDPHKIDPDTLRTWHEIGVRGARVNLVSVGREVRDSELRSELQAYARVLKPLDWVLQLYIPMHLAVPLEKIVPDLSVKVCIDHFGWPSLPEPYDPSRAIDPYGLAGFESLVTLLQKNTWVKLSAPYRLSKDAEMRDLDPIGRELIKEGKDRVVYATDWPHTRYDDIDSVPFIERCFEWCGTDTGLIEKFFRDNAEDLWDAPTSR
ncbi:hypothetical protein LTR10_021770 [Elasticomyces elasticus]|uniref:Amidohydrolase-related domain-containing protein n=1 Tax=Exophiala sideris TaxID=1016849 RepID=A0ABR0J6G9_9EURO|nr:hypothetical protein LTR10_021770 [Elasticomyces elasticus]KAK5028708.1 hypothetical protein LTS07_006087 [Exophiala sideris]KAK5035576.1 hypothetical protein LTR13_005705 [Exophiala sideris]KAK5057212.1 hypothetical protein LTR69_007251 [Exophiala sideris]KAK5181815.1 hypothetical protein LTR44_006015 [Eurotiomycetes sp. CCFEE 6388]